MRVYRSYPRGGALTRSRGRTAPVAAGARSLTGTHEPHGTPGPRRSRRACCAVSSIKWVRATKGDGVAFPGEADWIEVELADRLVRGCYLVRKAVAVN